jgi:hypothetical protein
MLKSEAIGFIGGCFAVFFIFFTTFILNSHDKMEEQHNEIINKISNDVNIEKVIYFSKIKEGFIIKNNDNSTSFYEITDKGVLVPVKMIEVIDRNKKKWAFSNASLVGNFYRGIK